MMRRRTFWNTGITRLSTSQEQGEDFRAIVNNTEVCKKEVTVPPISLNQDGSES